MSTPATSTPSPLSGLARKLVENQLLPADTLVQACEGAESNKVPLVRHLIESNLLDGKTIATAASQEFGIPLFDIDAMDLDVCAYKLVDEKLIHRHTALPLFKRGNRLFVALSDPTNLSALDEIKFHAGVTTEPILVEDDKLREVIAKILGLCHHSFNRSCRTSPAGTAG